MSAHNLKSCFQFVKPAESGQQVSIYGQKHVTSNTIKLIFNNLQYN